MITFDQFKSKRVGKLNDFDGGYGKQCVDLAKLFAREVHGQKIKGFSGSAINCWRTGSAFQGLHYKRVENKANNYPPRGAIVFFTATKSNPSGHVAVAGTSDLKGLRVIEQNAISGTGKGKKGDEISVREYTYKGARVGDVLGWYIFTPVK